MHPAPTIHRPDRPMTTPRIHDGLPATDIANAARRKARWDRIGLGIRMACNSARPAVIRLGICQGERLAADEILDDAEMWSRVQRTLLQVARVHTLRPTVWLATLLAPTGPAGELEVRTRRQAAHDLVHGGPLARSAGFHG
jgi:hypothetical protein